MRALNMQALTNDVRREYPGVVIYGKGDDAHALRISDHNEDDTVGSKAAQADPDTDPEHRAIDVMLGPAFTVAQAWILINTILSNPVLRKRLLYINFLNFQWRRSNGWLRSDNSHDPHPTHIHFSGDVLDDANSASWLGVDMTPDQEQDLKFLAGRVHALTNFLPKVVWGPATGEPGVLVQKIQELLNRPAVVPAPVDTDTVRVVLAELLPSVDIELSVRDMG